MFLTIAMSVRSGFNEEETRAVGNAELEEATLPITLALRFELVDAGTEAGGMSNDDLAATAGTTLLGLAAPIPRRARRSSRDRWLPGRTDMFFERELCLGDIAIRDSSDSTPRV